MGENSLSRNVPANLGNAMRRTLQLQKQTHVARLSRLPEPFLNELSPDRPTPMSKIFTEYNACVAEELGSYAQNIRREVLRGASKVNGRAAKEEVNAVVLYVLDEMLDSALYEKRFNAFVESVERHFSRYGIAFDMEKYRPDLYRAAAAVHAINACKRARIEIENELDMLALAEASEPSGSGRYQRLQDFVRRNNELFKLLSFLAAAVGALVALLGVL